MKVRTAAEGRGRTASAISLSSRRGVPTEPRGRCWAGGTVPFATTLLFEEKGVGGKQATTTFSAVSCSSDPFCCELGWAGGKERGVFYLLKVGDLGEGQRFPPPSTQSGSRAPSTNFHWFFLCFQLEAPKTFWGQKMTPKVGGGGLNQGVFFSVGFKKIKAVFKGFSIFFKALLIFKRLF